MPALQILQCLYQCTIVPTKMYIHNMHCDVLISAHPKPLRGNLWAQDIAEVIILQAGSLSKV